jgi:UDP-2,3-diacylglucosamine pyrophosphatase LpxH
LTTQKTIVLSNCYFGYEGFDEAEFRRFLDHLQSEGGVDRLVLLGDILDLWRIDSVKSFSVAQEHLKKLHHLAKETYYIVENHDYDIRQSCLTSGHGEKFAWTIAYHAYLVDRDLSFVHREYLDIQGLPAASPMSLDRRVAS